LGFGTGVDWEVVGTEDAELRLDTPRYRESVTSPIDVAGRLRSVTGELHVQVRQPSCSTPLGQRCCRTVDGIQSTWDYSVSFERATDPALTVIVYSTDVEENVERFAITGVQSQEIGRMILPTQWTPFVER